METEWVYWGILLSAIRLATPLLFAGMGGLLSERGGVANIALEGFLLVGAFSAAAATSAMSNPWMGLVAAIVAGAASAGVFGLMTITFNADAIVAGTALNLMAFGGLPVISKALFNISGSTPSLPLELRLNSMGFFFAALILIAIVHIFLFRNKRGLRLRAMGENADAARSLGISPEFYRYLGVIASGVLTAMGGAFLSIAHGSQFTRGMSAGRGFIALAALILANWKPLWLIPACLFFGFTDAAQILLQSVTLPNGTPIPVQFIQAAPYIITILVLVGVVGKSEAPLDLGKSMKRKN